MSLFKATTLKAAKFRIALFIVVIFFEGLLILFFITPLILSTPVAFVRIKSDSMAPALKTGNIVLIKGLGKDRIDILEGEIIAFYDPLAGKIIVHRAIRKKDRCLITKGDNSDSVDFFQPCQEYIFGKVIFKI
jgi:signal peptidase I